MGGGKPHRLLGGQTLLARAIERAQSWSDCVAIAVRSAEQVEETGVRIFLDPPGLEGPLGGLASGLRLERPTVITIPCDSPFLPDNLVDRLTSALPGHGAALPASGGRLHPVCGLWRADVLAEVRAYAASGRRSLIGFAETIGYARVEWPEGAFFNVNTAEHLAEAEARLS
jgi:molybdopterin-guanine dinucleotide biosynthesis protein A